MREEKTSTKPERGYSEESFILLLQTARVVNKYYNTYLNKKLGLSIPKIATLTVLAEHGGVMNPSNIADEIYTERNNISTLVARMSKEGLVTVERDQDDKRLVNVKITKTGRDYYNRAVPFILEVVNRITKGLSVDNAFLIDNPLRIFRQNAKDGLDELIEDK